MILYFFIVMICCTLIARTAASMTVAKVKTEETGRGSLVDEFEGVGSIQAKERAYQSLPEGQKVADILADPGSAVHAGDWIIQFDSGFLEEKMTEQAQEIEKLEYRIEQQRLLGASPKRTPATAQAGLTLDDAAERLGEAQMAYQQAQNRYEEAETKELEENLTTEEEKQRLQSEMETAYTAMQEAERAYRLAQGAYQIAQQDEANSQANDATAEKASQMALSEMQVELTVLQNKMEQMALLKEAGGIVTAQTDGVFASVGAEEGSVTTGEEQIVLIVGNLEACGNIPEDKIATITAGDEIEAVIQGETKKRTLTVDRVGQDEEGTYVWYAPLPEASYRVGTSLDYRYSRKSDSIYDILIPLSALRESGGSSYVLIAQMKPGILGESYTAVKVNVTVLGKDDHSAAVETNLPQEAKLITESSKYVKEGDRVRLNE